jgi:hypothetical protein
MFAAGSGVFGSGATGNSVGKDDCLCVVSWVGSGSVVISKGNIWFKSWLKIFLFHLIFV